MSSQIKLSVNVNKIATLRNARGKNLPDLLKMTKIILKAGANGITVHPRPDERHIRYSDIPLLKKLINDYQNVEFNIEGYPSDLFLDLIEKTLPHQCTLVPDSPDVLTSNAGWIFKKNESFLKKQVEKLKSLQVRSSLFLDPFSMDNKEWASLEIIRPDCVELYTESYAENFKTKKQKEIILKYKEISKKAFQLQIGVHAGHDLNQENLSCFLKQVSNIKEVSIGQALISESLEEGLNTTVKKYLTLMEKV